MFINAEQEDERNVVAIAFALQVFLKYSYNPNHQFFRQFFLEEEGEVRQGRRANVSP